MNISKARQKVQKTKDYFLGELAKIRGSRANPHLIEDILVEVYGSKLPIKQLGTVNVVDPTLITVQCWDQNNADAISKAVEKADLNVVPSVDGSIVRVPLPSLTEERREELVKIVKKIAEDTKISMRRIRRDFLDHLEEEGCSEDELERGKKDMQSLVEEFNDFVEDELEKKEKELMSI
ncbi:ribosome recycling factor [Candidatus Dojkabacteria bacterium]|nr:ribosome recycling factor [Candidatus Dojkabacteria bacterium]